MEKQDEIDMAEENRTGKPHILTLPYPSQGHINPLLHLSKRLASKGAKTTLATTVFITKSFTVCPATNSLVHFDTISDGFDDGGFSQAESIESYLSHLQAAGSKSLAELIQRHKRSCHPIDCIVYDAFLPWAVDVAKAFGLRCAAFFTQPCAVNYIYYLAYNGVLVVPGDSASLMKIPGMPEMVVSDMPSFIAVSGSYSAYFELVLNQFCNVEKADAILVNSFHQLEPQAVGCFFTHCGWNSTVEALSLGVVMVGMPQWTDQPTNAKLVEDFWQVGKRVKVDENGVVGREEIESCIKEVMERKDLKKNALKWRELAKEAVCEGGSSDRNIDQFISKISSAV